MFALALAVAFLLAGSLIYCLLVVVAARNYLAQKIPTNAPAAPISVLKPLAGADEGLEANLRSFFEQDHPQYELLFGVRDSADPAANVVEALIAQFPARTARLLITGEPPYPNAKVYSLERMVAESCHDIL